MNLLLFGQKRLTIDFNSKTENYACCMQNNDADFFYYGNHFE